MVNAVLLAGTPNREEELIYGRNRAFLDINKRYVVEYVMDALDETISIDNIAVVGPKKSLEKMLRKSSYKKNFSIVDESYNETGWKRFLENLENGYQAIRKDEHVLYIPGDIPLVNSKLIDAFVLCCYVHNKKIENNDYYYSCVDNDVSRDKWMHERPGFKINEGKSIQHLRSGNLSYVNPEKIGNKELLAKGFCSSRKMKRLMSRIKLMFDAGMESTLEGILRYYITGVKIKDMEDYVGGVLKTRFKIVKSYYPESEYDIDNEFDYENIKRILIARAGRRLAAKVS